MTSAVAGNAIHDQIIQEVFIDPIRTVIVVDDEYPTLDSLTAKEVGEKECWNGEPENVQRVRELLGFARSKVRPWLVDVHDGKKVTSKSEQGIAPHLDHSDLLVLDYHLDGIEGKGDAAIDILRKLAQNDHFNLVIVHTKGYEGDLDQVVREIALGLTFYDPELCLTEPEMISIKEALAQWEEHDDGITSKLEGEISEDTYLKVRNINCNGLLSLEEGHRLLEFCKAVKTTIKIDPKALAKWLVMTKQAQLKKQFSTENLGHIQVGRTAETNWIRTDKLFVTVLSKGCSPAQFETKLVNAIKSSSPSPHRLLLTKMRSEIDQHGLTAEAMILGNRNIQAEWLNDFLKPDSIDPRGVINNTINRHWEALGDQLRFSLSNFAKQLYHFYSPLGTDKVMAECGLNKSDVGTAKTLKYFNCFTSTKPIDRSHLTTGHVFRKEADVAGGEPEFWICLSPACDMVPGQNNYPGLSDSVPFVAVFLHKVAENCALSQATKNVFLFLDIDGEIETFSIHKDGNVTANLNWVQVFARNQGYFHEENKLTLSTIVEKDRELTANWFDAVVVAQLRSEYALNLLQRVGALLSRPGLGMNFKGRTQQ